MDRVQHARIALQGNLELPVDKLPSTVVLVYVCNFVILVATTQRSQGKDLETASAVACK